MFVPLDHAFWWFTPKSEQRSYEIIFIITQCIQKSMYLQTYNENMSVVVRNALSLGT